LEDKVRIDYFESVAGPTACSRWTNAADCRPTRLQEQTRVYWQDQDTGGWRAGRIVGGDQAEYFVRLPNSEIDFKVPESQLRVRWDMPVRNPVDVLVAGANESGYFSNARVPMMRNLVMQRAACGSAFALLSSGIEIFPHQVDAAMTVISDPVQRYLLADEVGLGKTIEAGLVIRQVLLDEPMSKIAIIAPKTLRRQWQYELRSKFFVDDFPFATIKISSHKTPEKWQSYQGYDLIVVDEAQLLAQVDDPAQSPYRELAGLARSVERVLLLSATPLTSRVTTHLALLHLLEPHLYKWTEQEAFEHKFLLRRELANAVYGLDSDYEQLLPTSIAEIEELIPADLQFRRLSRQTLTFLTEDGDLRTEDDRTGLAVTVEALRAHISETYRLHRRMIRHRRVQVTRGEDPAATLPYELTGRSRPTHIVLDSRRQQLVEEALLNWQSGIANWLMDAGHEKEAKAYGQVLGVLVSRADGASSDLSDALRWRLNGDESAAECAGLTSEERALLSTPPIAHSERGVLSQLSSAPDDNDLTDLADALQSVLKGQQRVVVFCGAGTLAVRLAGALARDDPRLRIGEHTHAVGIAEGDAVIASWRKDGGVLVADDSAEEGLNLQVADAVVHCRLPWSPNRLEQRIGRVDRYQAGVVDQPAQQFVVIGTDGEFGLPGSWLAMLEQAFGIFGQSVSALQDSIDQGLADIWAVAALSGPEGINRLIPTVTNDLAEERREIDGMDMLEAIHNARTGVVDIATAIGELEVDWQGIEAATMGFASGAAGGLRFLTRTMGPGGQVTQFERGNKPPLVPPRILAQGGTHLTPEMMRGAFDRAVTLKVSGTRMLRSGNPFIDMLARTVWIDDRGQATVLERRYPGEAHVYFGFDFLAEADIEVALDLVNDDPIGRNALRRQADCLLPPFTRRVWIPLPGKAAVVDLAQLRWLDQPYKPKQNHGPDTNLNAQRIDALFDKFGSRDRFAAGARFAEHIARNELDRVTDLRARCEEARQQATSHLAVRRAQAEARKAAGRIVTDTESYATDLGIADALIDGLANPRIKVISVTCLVRGALPGVDRD
jgi:ATP-dependent helicase HepA